MKKLAVDEITDSTQILAREVTSSSGSILLSKGTVVTPALGRRLKNWGISLVYVEGDEDVVEAGGAVTVSPEAIRSLLEKKFSLVINNYLMKKIFAATYQFKMQSGSK